MAGVCFLLFLQLALSLPALANVLPTAPPTADPDSWQCATEHVESYMNFATPVASLAKALISYAQLARGICTITPPATVAAVEAIIEDVPVTATPMPTEDPDCAASRTSFLCGFSTTAPPQLLPSYTSFAELNRVIWSAQSESMSDLADRCPYAWWNTMLFNAPSMGVWVTEGVVHAECHQSAFPEWTPTRRYTETEWKSSTRNATGGQTMVDAPNPVRT